MGDPAEPDPNDVAQAMAQMMELVAPIFEAGKGLRAKLEADGWSPTMAELMAAETISTMLRAVGR